MTDIDIIIALPSLNEEDSIAYVTRVIDEGLRTHFPKYRSLILNVDSSSTDNTRNVFLNTETRTTKKSLVVNGIGKGRNLFMFFSYASETRAQFCATFDTDLTSIRPDWINKMLSPVISGDAEYVVPIYRRNRYEGNTTNHFCYPILRAYMRTPIRQPYAGDFAFHRNVLNHWLCQYRPPGVNDYGIDIFMSLHAAAADFRIYETCLDQKVHKPSFGKMVPMFRQAAATTLGILSGLPTIIRMNGALLTSSSSIYRSGISEKYSMPDITMLQERRELAMELIEHIMKTAEELKFQLKMIADISRERGHISADLWVESIHSAVVAARRRSFDDKYFWHLAEQLLPIYLFRVLSWFEEIKHLSPNSIESLIDTQAEKLESIANNYIEQP